MAILGLTEQLLLRRAREGTPHYAHCLHQLETFAEALAGGDQEQDLFGEGFESDEEDLEDALAGPPRRAKAAQGRIMCAARCCAALLLSAPFCCTALWCAGRCSGRCGWPVSLLRRAE